MVRRLRQHSLLQHPADLFYTIGATQLRRKCSAYTEVVLPQLYRTDLLDAVEANVAGGVEPSGNSTLVLIIATSGVPPGFLKLISVPEPLATNVAAEAASPYV